MQEPPALDEQGRSLTSYWDLCLIAILAALAAVIVNWGDFPIALQLPLGLFLCLVAPGYAIAAALFPRRGEVAPATRQALCLGLSIAVIPPIALALSFTPLLIRPTPVAGALALTAVIGCAVAAYQRSRLGVDDAFVGPFRTPDVPRHLPTSMRLVVAAGAAATAALIYAIAFSGESAPYTAFSISGPSGRLEDLPISAVAYEEVIVRIEVTNREGEDRDYTVRASMEGRPVAAIPMRVAKGATEHTELSIAVGEAGRAQKVELLLFAGDSPQPARSLHFFIDVTTENVFPEPTGEPGLQEEPNGL